MRRPDPIRKKLVRRLLEEQDQVLRSYLAQRVWREARGGQGPCKGREHVKGHVCVKQERSTLETCQTGDPSPRDLQRSLILRSCVC